MDLHRDAISPSSGLVIRMEFNIIAFPSFQKQLLVKGVSYVTNYRTAHLLQGQGSSDATSVSKRYNTVHLVIKLIYVRGLTRRT